MLEDDAQVPETQGTASLYKSRFTDGKDLSTHDACHLHPHGQTDGDEHLSDAFAQGESNRDDEQQGRDGPHHVDEPNHRVVDLATEKTAQAAHHDANHQTEQYRDEAYCEADAASQHQAAEEITPELVGA